MENKLAIAKEAAALVGKEVPAMWILWAYVDEYQRSMTSFGGAH
jgi:hypothetical protein